MHTMIAPSDYTRIERAITWLEEHASEQPALSEAARAAGLSETHFQKLFTHWAGISPKRFLQARTSDLAVRLLRDGLSVLDASYEAGLSGSSRLHELIVHAEAVTPGELKERGAGLEIRFGWVETLFGGALIGATPRGLCFLAFGDPDSRAAVEADFRGRWPAATLIRDDKAIAPLAAMAFPQSVKDGGPLALHVRGTNFQLRVWTALMQIPPAATTTYADIGRAIGRPGSARAVGGAVGANPVSWLIPCHRVLRGDGTIGGYAWGPGRKRVMLAWEGVRKSEERGAKSE